VDPKQVNTLDTEQVTKILHICSSCCYSTNY